jgi:hypothetical protein
VLRYYAIRSDFQLQTRTVVQQDQSVTPAKNPDVDQSLTCGDQSLGRPDGTWPVAHAETSRSGGDQSCIRRPVTQMGPVTHAETSRSGVMHTETSHECGDQSLRGHAELPKWTHTGRLRSSHPGEDQSRTEMLRLLRYTVLVGVRLELARHLASERGIWHLNVASVVTWWLHVTPSLS